MAELLTIDHVGHRGDGVAFANGRTAYVPYTLAGETIEVDLASGDPERPHLVRIVQPSSERIAPFCDYFERCGGCAIQHWQADAYRAWKRRIVIDTLAQAGIACEVGEVIDAHGLGRRRVTVHARRGTDGEPVAINVPVEGTNISAVPISLPEDVPPTINTELLLGSRNAA